MILTAVPWTPSLADIRFQRQVLATLAFAMALSIVVSLIPLAEPITAIKETKARFVEIILPELAPPTPAVAERPKPKPKPAEVKPKPEPVVKPLEVLVAKQPQTVKQAREKAKVSGLMAFQDQLKSMRDSVDTSTMQDTASLTRGAGEAARLERSVLTSNSASARRASVNVEALSSQTGGIALAGRESTIVVAPEREVAATGAVRLIKPDVNMVRSIEEIRRVFDANKGAIFSIYNRALRKDPSLLGKVVLQLVIEPDGTVSACDVVTSDLADEELISRVMRRVQLFDFGERDVAVTRISYPVHFLPT
ncbi:MAG: protein TonB [Candidatus Azotimanducaceae bacterium]|jgi:protein TonB